MEEEKGDITGQVFMNGKFSDEFAAHLFEDPFFELFFVAFFDMFSLPFLLIAVGAFISSWHVLPSPFAR